MNFCSHCGSARLLHTIPTGDNRLRHVCGDCGSIHYQNPKIVVGCIVLYEDQILLCKREIEPRAGMWNLPAGFMENGETVQEGALREVREEANAEVEILRLHTVFNVLQAEQVYLVFLARLHQPIFSAGQETTDARLFRLDEIPFDDLAFRSNHFALRRYIDDPSFTGVHINVE